MATREELIGALQQADEAGNTEDAGIIAEMIRNGAFEDTLDVPSLDEPFGEKKEPGFFETETGQLSGGIVFGLRGAQMGSVYGPWGTIAGGALGAGYGGFIGELGQQAWQVATDNPYSPKNINESLSRAFKAGGEEALYDLAGGLFFKGGSSAWNAIRPKPIEGIKEVQETITKYGGSLTASQMTTHRMVDTIETLSESAWGGGALKEARKLNDDAIVRYTNDYINTFNKNADEILSDEGLGALFINGIEVGNKLHSKIGGDMYSYLDVLYKPLIKKRTIVKEYPTGVLDATGSMLSKKTSQTIEKEVLPVSTKALKDFARKELKKYSGTRQKGMSSWGKKELEDILKFDDSISFAEAQAYRSKLLEEGRIASSGTGLKLGQGKTSSLITSLSGVADDIIEQGAMRTKNPEFIEAWRGANDFWKAGKETFGNKYMASLMKKNPSAIGKKLFNSDPEDVRKAQQALRKASKLSKGTANEFSFSNTWLNMQQGYVQKLIADTVTPQTGEISIPKLSKWFSKGTDNNKKLATAFTAEQIAGLRSFMNSVKAMQKLTVGEGSFMVTVGQAGLVLNALGGFGQTSKEAVDFTGDVAVYTITPYVLSKMLTRPKLAKMIAGVIRMKGRPKIGTMAWATISKLIAASQDIDLLGE